MKFDYTPGDVAGLLRKANLGCVRERIMWEAFDYLDPKHSDRLIDELTAAYAEHGIEVVRVCTARRNRTVIPPRSPRSGPKSRRLT